VTHNNILENEMILPMIFFLTYFIMTIFNVNVECQCALKLNIVKGAKCNKWLMLSFA